LAGIETPPIVVCEPEGSSDKAWQRTIDSSAQRTKIRVAVKTRVPTGLLAAAVVLALVGCDRKNNSMRSPASQSAQSPRVSAAAPVGYVYITNNGEGTLSEFSRGADGNLIFLRTEKVGAVNGPTGIGIDPSSRFLYVANEGDGRIYQFRIKRDTGELALIGEGSVDDGSRSGPQQIAISPHGDFLYVTNSGKSSDGKSGDSKNSDGSISEYAIDRATGALKPVNTFRGSGLRDPLGIAIMPNGRFVYVSDRGAGTIVAFAVEASGKLKLVASTPSLGDKPGRPGLVAVHPSGSFVYTVDRVQGALVTAKAAEDGRLTVTETDHVGITTAAPIGIALATVGPTAFVYTANVVSDTVSSFEVKPEKVNLVGECPTGMGGPTGMVADPAGHNLYVVNRNASTVAQFAIAQTNGVALIPAASIFTEASPSETSHPLYIATTRWDAPSSPAAPLQQRAN
jgi:DNA-binding beta-propeller fold protein YncE